MARRSQKPESSHELVCYWCSVFLHQHRQLTILTSERLPTLVSSWISTPSGKSTTSTSRVNNSSDSVDAHISDRLVNPILARGQFSAIVRIFCWQRSWYAQCPHLPGYFEVFLDCRKPMCIIPCQPRARVLVQLLLHLDNEIWTSCAHRKAVPRSWTQIDGRHDSMSVHWQSLDRSDAWSQTTHRNGI